MSVAATPAWLADSPEILALLDAALDRFDRQSSATRTRLLLSAEQHLPALARNDVAADAVWNLVRELENRGCAVDSHDAIGPI
jgi:hypothetical protein